MLRCTTDFSDEETFSIMDGSTLLYEQEYTYDYMEDEFEECLPASANHIYKLVMADSMSDSWNDESTISIYGVNGNLVLKAMMVNIDIETYNFALYAPINKEATWKYTNALASGWTQFQFDDNAWTDVTLGGTTPTALDTQYFRKTFAGSAVMSVMEAQFKYMYGIIAYVNGVEVFRDNMPAGEVTAATPSSGSYTSLDFHGVIRLAEGAASAQAVLAVELHFTAGHSDSINFDAFLALYPSISDSNNCYPISTPITSTGTIMYAYSATDYTRSGSPSASTGSLPATLYSTFGGNVLPVVNGFRIWSFSVKDNCPNDFVLAGGASASASEWTELAHPTEVIYQALSWKPFMLSGQSVGYKTMRMTLNSSPAGMVKLPELQFLICKAGSVTISYPEAAYTFYAKYSMVSIAPNSYGISNCQITPALPNGLTLNPNTCGITGTATVSAPQTVYSVTAQVSGAPASGTVTLTFSDCAGSMLRILRTYRYSPSTEGFRIRNTDNDELLLNVATGNTFPLNRDREDFFCVTVSRYDVTVEGTNDDWSSKSYLYIYELLPEGEQELLVKMRYDSLQANDMTYYLRRHEISPMEQWYYKMGEVPANWYSESVDGWSQGVRGSFPESTNQIQLYKKTFTVSDLSVVSGYILSIRYKYGCVVYLNGHEAWRNRITGELSATSMASESYTDVKYRIVTLPGKSIVTSSGESAKEFLKQGTNVIAIAIVGMSAQTPKTSLFDATVRLMTNHPEGHLWELGGTITGMYGPASNAFDLDHSTNVYHPSCGSNSMIITLDNDRREWVSSVEIQASYASAVTAVTKFDLYARVKSTDEWTLLTSVSGLTYSDPAQKRRIYFSNPTSYNQFKFENLGTGKSLACTWMLQSINMYAENVVSDMTPLTYPASASAYVNIEMADVIPEGAGYSNFRIQPALPAGLVFDAFTGWISGTATEEKPSVTYTITANRITGGDISVTLNFSVEVCTGGKSLVTMRIRADEYQNENLVTLYRGRGTTGDVIQTVSPFPVKNTLFYLDHCLVDGLYTFMAQDEFGDGWESGAGYTLTADMGEMVIEINQVPHGAKPVQVTTVFSSFFPFQVEFTQWKVFQGEVVAEGWNTASFDDAAWETKKAAEIANPNVVTTYIRKSFQLTGVDDYQVLNVRMKYAGGVAVYFNGNQVARFNLIEDFDSETESIEIHDATIFSKFHIILPTSGAQEGTNVIAFEVHRPVGTSSSEPFVFDATGVFGVETCSTVLDTYTSISSSSMPRDKIDLLMDFDVFTTTVPSLDIGFFIQWTVENQLGSKWNSYNMLTTAVLSNLGYALYGSLTEQESWDDQITMVTASAQTITDRVKTELPVPVALVGFRKFRWEILSSGSTTTFNTIAFSYCKATGAVCPAVGNYPSVGEGQISASTCPESYSGYSFRECAGGVLGEIDTTNCKHKLPKNVFYRPRYLQFVIGTSVSTGRPQYENIVTQWRLRSGEVLPAGLTLNEETGEISGTPTEELARHTFTVIAENPTGAVDVVVDILVRRGECNAEGVFGKTLVGETAEYKCSSQGSYIGTQKRACVLGEKDGVWEKSSGVCISLGTIVLLVVVVVIVIVVVVILIVRKSKRTKSTAGAKAKKTMKKSAAKQEKGKNVKI